MTYTYAEVVDASYEDHRNNHEQAIDLTALRSARKRYAGTKNRFHDIGEDFSKLCYSDAWFFELVKLESPVMGQEFFLSIVAILS